MAAFGKKHGDAFEITDPSGVLLAMIFEMGFSDKVEPEIFELSMKRDETDALEENVAAGVADDIFFDSELLLQAGVGDFESRGTAMDKGDLMRGVLRFIGKKIPTIRDNKTGLPEASLIGAGVVYLREVTVAEREPDKAAGGEGGADSGFGAGGPLSWKPRSAWGRRLSFGHNRSLMLAGIRSC